MKKKFTFMMAAVMLLVFVTSSLAGWGQTRSTVTDQMTHANLAATGSSYTNFSNVSLESDAVYAGNSAREYNNSQYNIQLRSNNSNSGIVTTSSGGTIKSITITVAHGTNTIDVYGKNTAYSAASDLYNSNTQGTKIGSLSSTGTINVTDSYAYVGIRSKSGAIYLSSIDFVWDEGDGSAVATTTAIDASNITNTDVYVSTTAGSLTASVTETESGEAISGATITWTSSDTDVATIDNNGAVTLVAVGTTTITASYAGESGVYAISSATYELTVTSSEPYVQPTEIEITPNYTFWGKDGQFSGSTFSELEGSKDNVTLNWTRGEGSTYANASAMRFYKDNTLTFTAPEGYEIESIVITMASGYAPNDITFSLGNYSLSGTTGTWTGSSEAVTMSRPSNASSYAQISKFTITLAAQGNAVATTTTINVPQNFNTDIHQGTSAGTLTAMVKDNEDNTISGATVTWSSGNTGVATIDANGAVTLVAVGTTTITASYAGVEDEYRPSEGTYELTVIDSYAPGTQNNPYTVAQARAAIDASTGTQGVYVAGIIYQVDNFNSNYNSITYWISDDGTTANPLEVYSGISGIQDFTFSSIDDLHIGDEVVVHGNLKKYNSTYEFDYNNELVSLVRPITPIIVANDINLTYDAIEGSIAYTISNPTGATLTATSTADWISNITVGAEYVTFTTTANEGDADRSSTITLSYTDAADKVITVTQAHYVPDYATLPFVWEGGSSAGFAALNGVTLSGNGSDYNSNHAPYLIKLDGTGDYIQVKTDSQPGTVTIGVKMIGGSDTSTITIQGSADGETFTDVEELTISGAQNEELTLETSKAFAANVRYVRMLFTKGSNVGVGPIRIAKQISGEVSYEDLTISENETYIVSNGGILTVTGTLTNTNPDNLIIEEGGQLITSNSVKATVEKTIYASEEKTTNNWYVISSPVDEVEISSFVSVAPDKWNVYRYDETEVEWEEYRDLNNPFSTLANGRGYLYRSTVADIDFVGDVNVEDAEYQLTYTSTVGDDYAGFHLIGNPFTHNIYKGENGAIDDSDNLEDGFYTLSSACAWVAGTDNSTAIAPTQAILVQAKSTANGETLYITNTTEGGPTKYGNDQIMFAVKNAEYSDVAYVLFKEGHGLNKVEHRNAEIPMLYVINNGEEFAIADMSDNTGVINLGFEAKTMGQYTISLKAEGQYSYMHLIDKLTGEDTDMLVEDSYTFVGSQSDRNDRFVLRLNYNAAGIDSESDIFAYQNGNDIIVRGEGTLQVFDITGRMVMSTRIDSVETINGIESGVYIFRMEGKTQKIVVR
jgi:hypothetical protein